MSFFIETTVMCVFFSLYLIKRCNYEKDHFKFSNSPAFVCIL